MTATRRSRRTTKPSTFSSDHRLLLSCIAEVFYRCRQVELYIEPIARQTTYSDPAATITNLIQEGRQDTQTKIRQAEELPIPVGARSNFLNDALRLIAKRFNRAHERLSVFPSAGVRPEASQMLAHALGVGRVPPILLTSLFNALEFNLAPELV